MTTATIFEDFSDDTENNVEVSDLANEALEDEKLKSFEQGYCAGWDDAIKAQQDEGRLLSETIRESVALTTINKDQALKACYGSSQQFFSEILDKLLPQIADEAFLPHVLNMLEQAQTKAVQLPIELRVSNADFSAVMHQFSSLVNDSIALKKDNTLDAGQATFAFGEHEAQIDIQNTILEISNYVKSALSHSIRQANND